MDFKYTNWKEFFEEAINFKTRMLDNNVTLNYGEQINAIYDYVAFKYDTKISGEGYVYSGAGVGKDGAAVYQIVDGICKVDDAGYITSTQAGSLFNDPTFQDKFTEFIKSRLPYGTDSNIMWNGDNGMTGTGGLRKIRMYLPY